MSETVASPLLAVGGVTVKYGQVTALDDVSLRVEEGEVVCLLGSNGAGKSTLMRAIVGLVPLASGSITYRGVPMEGLPVEDRVAAGVALVPEGRGVLPQMSVLDNLLLGGYLRGGERALTADLDRVFSLFPILRARTRQLAGTLSGGEQQMMAIARALMARPKLLLMDEPSMGLAPVIVEQVFDIIHEIHRLGSTVFLVEQNAHLALSVAGRGYVLQKGKVMLEAPAGQLLREEELKEAYLGS